MEPTQQRLFEDDAPQWVQDDSATHCVATVIFATGPQQQYDYAVPETLLGEVQPGKRLRVPFGRGDRMTVAYCVAVEYRELKEEIAKYKAAHGG